MSSESVNCRTHIIRKGENYYRYNYNNSIGKDMSKATFATYILFGMLLLLPVALVNSQINAATGATNDTQFQFELTPIAPKIPADGGHYFAIIQLQTQNDGKPIEAQTDIDITLLSSDPSVLTIPQPQVILHKGESVAKAEFVTTQKAGEVSISAQAGGIKANSVTINTVMLDSLDPAKLAIYAAQSSFVPDPKVVGALYIQLLNSQGLPSATKTPVVVSLSSSKPEVGTVPSFVTIPAGQSGVGVDFSPKSEIGITTISASSPGLLPFQLGI